MRFVRIFRKLYHISLTTSITKEKLLFARMAVPIKEFKITEVKQPNIGEVKPSSVTADVTFSISSYKAQIRSEWNALKEHDVLFLLSMCPSFEPLLKKMPRQVCHKGLEFNMS